MINNVLDLLRADGSIVVNKKLAKKIGLIESVIYAELVSLYKYWSDRGELTEGKWFYCTFENLEKNTTISERTARRKVTELEKLGLIESDLKGLPAKKHYRITDKILEVLGLASSKVGQNGRTDITNDSSGKIAKNIDISRSDKMAELEQTKWPTNNTILNNTYLEEEEEEEGYSDLISFLKSKDITIENAIKFESTLIKEDLTGYTNEDVLKAIEMSLTDFIKGDCNEPYIWAVGKLKRLLDSKGKGDNKKATRQKNKPIRTEKLPEWFNEEMVINTLSKNDKDYEKKKADLEERLKKYKK